MKLEPKCERARELAGELATESKGEDTVFFLGILLLMNFAEGLMQALIEELKAVRGADPAATSGGCQGCGCDHESSPRNGMTIGEALVEVANGKHVSCSRFGPGEHLYLNVGNNVVHAYGAGDISSFYVTRDLILTNDWRIV